MKKKELEKIIKQNQKDIDNLYSLIAKLALQNKDYEQVYSIKQKFVVREPPTSKLRGSR